MSAKNQQISEFLDYYYQLPKPPQYAVMIRGNWGSGKTWFVERSIDRVKAKGAKVLYVSLYGMSSKDEIEDSFYRQLHPILSSKAMLFTGKLAKGLLKGALKIDLDGDGKDDGTVSVGVPDIDLREFLTTDQNVVLVFDDLERCSIPIVEVLGYVNHFVEHGGFKVVIVAHEKEIEERDLEDKKTGVIYRRIKEKLIGKTFEVEPIYSDAFDAFCVEMQNPDIKILVEQQKDFIGEVYDTAGFRNLRHLRQAILDFDRIASVLTGEQRRNVELVKHFLAVFLIYSFEVKGGSLTADDIGGIASQELQALWGSSVHEDTERVYSKLRKKYGVYLPRDLLLPDSLWSSLMKTGLIDEALLRDAVYKSSYFPAVQPEWIALWNYLELSDDEVERSLIAVKKKFEGCEYEELGTVFHVFRILEDLALIGVGGEAVGVVLEKAKRCVDKIDAEGGLIKYKNGIDDFNKFAADGRGYCGKKSSSFDALLKYAEQKIGYSLRVAYNSEADGLLDLLVHNADGFCKKLFISNSTDCVYFNVPILCYLSVGGFVDAVSKLKGAAIYRVVYVFNERYNFETSHQQLAAEFDWLIELRGALQVEVQNRKGKVSAVQFQHLQDAVAKAANALGKYVETERELLAGPRRPNA
ncbi:MAG: P-loop NTPase fold protein [Ralstonia sp.]|uniref:P-loop NTPase fold protein n=1 Tax=Ralstonia sp. TaxID=54061 RepID=UPI003F7FBB1F